MLKGFDYVRTGTFNSITCVLNISIGLKFTSHIQSEHIYVSLPQARENVMWYHNNVPERVKMIH